jgi:hypothetical protein
MRGEKHTQIVSDNLKDIWDRVELKKASALILDGSLGEGKTTEAVNIADEINEMCNLKPIQFKEQLALGGQDFIKKIQTCYEKEYPVVIYDEAGDYSKKGAMSRFNKSITNVFETFRAYKLIVIMCLPYFNTLDNSMFKHNAVRILFHCSDRTEKDGFIKAYGIDEMGWLRVKMDEYKYREWNAYAKVLPNFRARFWDLTEARSKELDEYCTKGKLKILKKAGINMNNLIDKQGIALQLGMSKNWVERKLSELNAKPETRLFHSFYFDNKYVETLKKMKKH